MLIEKPYGKALREKGVRMAAVPGGTNSMSPPSKKEPGHWEQDIVTETRPGGGVVPLLDSNLKPIRRKGYADNRRKYEQGRKLNAERTRKGE